jgi:hypothetical protein
VREGKTEDLSGRRTQLAPSRTVLDPRTCVFINCPFDHEYQSLFDAVIFACVACRFKPRSAIESDTASESRIDRIWNAIRGSHYSIHDLSRFQGEGEANLARLNMPLELGFAMARRFTKKTSHDWLILVPEGQKYAQFISDLRGYDLMTHRETPQTVVPPVVTWLKTRQDLTISPMPDEVVDGLPAYLEEVGMLRSRYGGHLPWSETIRAAQKHASMLERQVSLFP